jgi:hypothetical protein
VGDWGTGVGLGIGEGGTEVGVGGMSVGVGGRGVGVGGMEVSVGTAAMGVAVGWDVPQALTNRRTTNVVLKTAWRSGRLRMSPPPFLAVGITHILGGAFRGELGIEEESDGIGSGRLEVAAYANWGVSFSHN